MGPTALSHCPRAVRIRAQIGRSVAGLIGIVSAAICSVGPISPICCGADRGGSDAHCNATSHRRTTIVRSAIGGPAIGGSTIGATAIGDSATAIGRAIGEGVI